ncbi:TPA: Rpn family recombination-promoting nuclease/putative transposase, partial [Escherichia coli]|nr:Rpn family recombination-promoting nuclease/putative transposase [Escherichia coli]
GLLDDEGIRHYQQMAALMLLMKVRQRKGDLIAQLDFLSQLLQIQGTHDQVVVLLNYMVKACDSASPEFIRAMAEHLPRYEDDIMTIAERLELAGIEKGRQEEREKALEKMLEAARRMQKMGMSPESIQEILQLSDEELQKALG